MAEKRWHSLADVAATLGLSRETVRRRVNDGSLSTTRVGGRVLVANDELERFVAGTTLPSRTDEAADLLDDPVRYVAAKIGVSPRVAALRPELADEYEVVSPGEHFARFSSTFCRHTRLVEGGPPLGSPVEMEAFQRELFDEALECDDDGRRVYSTAGAVWPRKTAKTTSLSILSLYAGSPADGEHRPEVILAASVKHQAGKLYGNATAFVNDPLYGSPELRRLFTAQASAILCPSVGGIIQRVAGDGDSNHSLDPHLVALDELHTWKTPKQRENFNALTTAQGARVDPMKFFISTEGEDDENELARLLERIEGSDEVEVERRRPGLTIYRSRETGLLVFKYAIPGSATIQDVDAFVDANPAPWRTRARIAKDLRDPTLPEATKLRLYGNRRGSGAGRWITDERWDECESTLEIPDDAVVVLGVDAARTRDTTGCGWAWSAPDGRIFVRSRVWTCVEGKPHHDGCFVPGGRLDNDLVVEFIREELLPRFACRLLFFDERYFDTQAHDLSRDGMTVVEMHQGKPEMRAAWNELYDAIHLGERPALVHDGDRVLRQHVRNAVGVKQQSGDWKVDKVKSDKPIDGLAAVVMARYGAAHFATYQPKPRRHAVL